MRANKETIVSPQPGMLLPLFVRSLIAAPQPADDGAQDRHNPHRRKLQALVGARSQRQLASTATARRGKLYQCAHAERQGGKADLFRLARAVICVSLPTLNCVCALPPSATSPRQFMNEAPTVVLVAPVSSLCLRMVPSQLPPGRAGRVSARIRARCALESHRTQRRPSR